ncbi:MAG: alpha/beta fold hydrolase [Betaproteobacteria bacterium]|nr:MAG: alpha/beta fold hydrolase [Betaproteobacteria bacterium]
MRKPNGSYGAPGWLPGGHAQTIYPVLIRRPEIAYRRQRIETPDGDFIDFDWLDSPTANATTPLVALFHGLEGNSRSHYALALMTHLRSIGWRGVVPHFRGCSGELNRRPRAYHSGDYTEVAWMLETIRGIVPDTPLFAVGVSLGGSALLNWLGREEHRAARIVAAAAAVSAPLDLTAAGIAIEQGLNRIYSRHFRSTLVPKAMAMARQFPGTLDAAAIARVDTMYHFDDVVTAPLHGFTGTDDYWHRASSKPWLKAVAVPTLVLNARNDPFIPASSLPTRAEAGAATTLEQPDDGGHAGFPEQRFPGRPDWLPQRLVTYFSEVRRA